MSQPPPTQGIHNTKHRFVHLISDLLSNVRTNKKPREAVKVDLAASESPDPQKLCNFLNLLPLEIRQAIYRLLFTRPVPIMPGPVHFRYVQKSYIPSTDGFEAISMEFGTAPYTYQWNTRWQLLQRRDDDHPKGLPMYGGTEVRHVPYDHFTNPNSQQQAMIDSGAFQTNPEGCPAAGDFLRQDRLLSAGTSIDGEVEAKMLQIWRRGEFPTQILNRSTIRITGIFGTQLLQTCHQIHDEAIEFLYGNTFAFNFRPESDWNQHLLRKERRRAMDRTPFSNVNISSIGPHKKIQVSRGVHLSLAQFFDRQFFQGRASGERYRIEPLAHFFNEIGEANTKRIKSVMFEGFFETYHTIPVNNSSLQVGGSFDEILLLAARALQKLCPDLEQLTLKRAASREHDSKSRKVTGRVSPPAVQLQGAAGHFQTLDLQAQLLACQSQGTAVMTMTINPTRALKYRRWNSRLMGLIIGKVAERMKSLHKFQLIYDICCDNHNAMHLKAWGDTLKWEVLVQQRHEKQKLNNVAEVAKRDVVTKYLDQRL